MARDSGISGPSGCRSETRCRRSTSTPCCDHPMPPACSAAPRPHSATSCSSWVWWQSMWDFCWPSSATCRPSSRACRASRASQDESEQVIHDIGHQIRSYLGVCTFLSVLMGGVCYVVLAVYGVDFAGFWALLMFFLTYIPTVGGVGVVLPALMALAQFGELGPALVILILLGITHFFLTNVVETVMLGRTLNLSPFAIIVSLTFWGLVWGVGGLFLAVPMTGAIAIACRHLDGLRMDRGTGGGPAAPSASLAPCAGQIEQTGNPLDGIRRTASSGPAIAAGQRDGSAHRGDLRDDGHLHAGSRYDDRQCRPALYAGQPAGLPRPDHLGADLLYRRGSDHDGAGGMAVGALRPQEFLRHQHGWVHDHLDDVRRGADARRDDRLPRCCRACSARPFRPCLRR